MPENLDMVRDGGQGLVNRVGEQPRYRWVESMRNLDEAAKSRVGWAWSQFAQWAVAEMDISLGRDGWSSEISNLKLLWISGWWWKRYLTEGKMMVKMNLRRVLTEPRFIPDFLLIFSFINIVLYQLNRCCETIVARHLILNETNYRIQIELLTSF